MLDKMETITVRLISGYEKKLLYKPLGGERLGSLVRVPLGSRTALGVVIGIGESGDWKGELKCVLSVEQPFEVVSGDGLKLCDWMHGYYSAPYGGILEVMIPKAVRRGMEPKQLKFIQLKRELSEAEQESLKKRAPKQWKIYSSLEKMERGVGVLKSQILKRFNVTASVVDGLVKKEIFLESKEEKLREAYRDELAEVEFMQGKGFQLNEEQTAAVEGIRTLMSKSSYATQLLHGVTGSGKTEVYLAAMKTALESGGSVIFLVPEVALTPQTVGRLRSRLEREGDVKAVVWHSHLSDGERFDAWRQLSTGEARVVVGARSAIFAPLNDLKLIIVDEEHEPAYKQEEVPRYNGRDVAVYRAMLNDAVCILGSATPSMETLRNVDTGKYSVSHLNNRVDNRQLPLMHIVDMRREQTGKGGTPVFSRFLVDKIHDRMEKGEQAILFINRRGYDASLRCPDCGYVAMCDHCDVTMTHHRADHVLRCHLCGAEEYVPRKCPKCNSPKIHYKGSGTQKVEDLVRKIAPRARVVRIDADTMQRKHSFRELLNQFRLGKIDILVGTQMIAKGLDFPNVTLVGLMDADLSMHLPDFRATERTFQLLVQVSGRAGRGDRSGEVVVQTYLPHAGPLQYARRQDFSGFAEEEMESRKEFGYPPFRHLIHHIFRGKQLEKVSFYSEQWVKHVRGDLEKLGVEIRGPSPCPIERIQDYFRFQVWYFVPNVSKVMPHLNKFRSEFKWDKEVIQVVDVDAFNLI